MRKLIVFGFWGDPSEWRVQQYVVELPRCLGREEDRYYVVQKHRDSNIYNFSSTLALVEGIIAGKSQAPENPLVKNLEKVFLHVFVPETLVFTRIRDDLRSSFKSGSENEDALRNVFESSVKKIVNELESSAKEGRTEVWVTRAKLARVMMSEFLRILVSKCDELSRVLGENTSSLGLELLDTMIKGVDSVYRSYESSDLDPYARLGKYVVEDHGVEISISLSLYPVALSNAFIISVGKNRRHVLLSVRRSNVGIFEDFMMCSIAVPAMALVYDALENEPRDVAVVIDTTHGLNYAMVNYLRGLDLALRLALMRRAIEAFIDEGVGRDLTLSVVYYNSDPVPRSLSRNVNPVNRPEVSLKLHVVRVDTLSSRGSALHILDSLRSLVFSDSTESMKERVARRLDMHSSRDAENIAKMGMAMISALYSAMPLWTAYFSKNVVDKMGLSRYVDSRNLNELLKDFSRALHEVGYKIRIYYDDMKMLMDVELRNTFGSERKFLPTVFTLTFALVGTLLYQAFRERGMISIDRFAEGNEVLCIHVSRNLCKLFEPVVEHSMFRILENELKDVERWLKHVEKGTDRDSDREGSVDERNFFAHAGLARGIVEVFTDVRVCKEFGDRVRHIDTVIEWLLKHFTT